jgi:hypothetical protein
MPPPDRVTAAAEVCADETHGLFDRPDATDRDCLSDTLGRPATAAEYAAFARAYLARAARWAAARLRVLACRACRLERPRTYADVEALLASTCPHATDAATLGR